MQAGLSFRKDFPIPQLYIDRIIIPEVSKVHSTLPQPPASIEAGHLRLKFRNESKSM
jgi:hypothetical protein